MKDLKSIVELYTAISQTQLLDFFKELKQFFHENVSQSSLTNYRKLEINTWELILKTVIFKRKKLTSIALVVQIIRHPFISKFRNELKKKASQTNASYPFLKNIFKVDNLQILEDKNSSDFNADEAFLALKDNTANSIESPNNLQIDTPQFFKNAGIILIHPFLSNFFKNLNLLDGNMFKDYKSQSKAVLLLHFLATGESNPPEYEMVLPKFLCEMPVNMPIDHTQLITDEEKEEANSLLMATLEHWGALGSTSPDGLREGFLSREGKLNYETTGWKLYVEQKTLDILLDRLPWNLSLIKLPWMKDILKVEWR